MKIYLEFDNKKLLWILCAVAGLLVITLIKQRWF